MNILRIDQISTQNSLGRLSLVLPPRRIELWVHVRAGCCFLNRSRTFPIRTLSPSRRRARDKCWSNHKCKTQQINRFTRTFVQPPWLPLSRRALIVSVFPVLFWLAVVLFQLQHRYIPIKWLIQARKTTEYVLTKNTPLGSTTNSAGPSSSTAPNIVLIPKGRTDEYSVYAWT